jgi:hypothetical protein
MVRLGSSVVLLASALALGCDYYDAPPTPSIEGGEDGVLEDPKSPLVISFAESVDPATIAVKVIRLVTDVEGNLGDEDQDSETDLNPLYSRDAIEEIGGTSELLEDNSKLRIVPIAPLPIGSKLAVLVEAGLKDLQGNVTKTRKRLTFGYSFKLECNAPTAVVESGYYFLLADIKQPLKVQVQLWGYFDVDPMTGKVSAQCTNADRNPDPNRCPTPCKTDEFCRLLPAPACVKGSERAGTVDEHIDYIPNQTPPTGYTFSIEGCVQDQPDGTTVFVTAPTEVIVQQPPVTLRNVTLGASMTKDAMGIVRGSGALAADEVLLGGNPSGKGEGNLDMRSVPADQAPKDLPMPMP